MINKSAIIVFLSGLICISSYGQTLEGKVYDDLGPLMEAEVKIAGTDIGVLTDEEGNFKLALPRNKSIDIVVSYTFYEDYTIKQLSLKKGETRKFSFLMVMEGGEPPVIDGKPDLGKANVLLTQQANSSKTFNGTTSQEIARTGDVNAAAAVKRISGVSIEGGKYVFVRGLGDRYTKTVLNGLNIPGLDPDRNSIQLDIFPSNIINNIKVYKTYSPDLPGDFTGGLVDIVTQDFPEKASFNISAGIGFNPQMHLNSDYITNQKGKRDWLGMDDGSRALPIGKYTAIPDEAIAGSELTNYTSSFSSNMAAQSARSLLNTNLAISGGDKQEIKLFGKAAVLGYNGALSYRNGIKFYETALYNRYTKDPLSEASDLVLQERRVGKLAQHNVIWSALGSAGLKFDKSKFNLILLHSQNGLNQTSERRRENLDQTGAILIEDILTYTQRSVSNATFKAGFNFNKFEVEASNAFTKSNISDPDFRTTAFAITTGDTLLALGDGAGVSRFFRNLDEVNNHSNFTIKFPFKVKGKESYILAGGSALVKSREFEVQSYQFRVKGQSTFNGDPNVLFQDENIWTPETETGTYVIGNFEPVNNFNASQMILAGFVMNELHLNRLKAVYGARLEKGQMWYTGQNNDGSISYRNTLTLDEVDVLPSVNLIYDLKSDDSTSRKMNLRASYNHTLARPSFKEKSIAQIFDPISSRTFIGNIDLKQTNVINYDFRWEYFMNRGELVSVSVFRKQFTGHIEMVPFETAPDNLKPRNSGNSSVTGLEIEVKKNLNFISTKLENWSFGANLTLVQSKMDMNTVMVSNVASDAITNTEYDSRLANAREGEVIGQYRQMTGQAPLMLNLGINYANADNGLNANVSYNVKGKTLTVVGIGLVPDVFSSPFHSLNCKLSKQFSRTKISLKAANILNQSIAQVYDSYELSSDAEAYFSLLHPGRTFSVSFAIALVKKESKK
jgi:hypothetical protein